MPNYLFVVTGSFKIVRLKCKQYQRALKKYNTPGNIFKSLVKCEYANIQKLPTSVNLSVTKSVQHNYAKPI